MRLTMKSEYALLALVHLARAKGGAPMPLAEIARAQKIPLKYLEHLASAMCHAGYLRSEKGRKGGYRMARRPSDISVAEVVRLFDGALAPTDSVSRHFYKSTPISREKRAVALLRDIRDYASRKLEGTSLKDLT